MAQGIFSYGRADCFDNLRNTCAGFGQKLLGVSRKLARPEYPL
jgi:hypothetical protein